MALPQLSGIIARQVGSIQGKLVSQVQGQVLSVLSKFTSQCPNVKELEKIIKIKNNLLKNINALERRIQKLRSVANKLDASIRTARVAIEIIKRIPIPTVLTFIPGQSGGLVKGVPYSTLTKLSDRLIKLNKLLDALEADKQGIIGVINTVSLTLGNLKRRLEVIDIGYTLEIVQDPNSPKIAPRRYAIAKDKAGIIVLYGPSSFSSDTQVLLDEIKFRIDNQLP